MTSDKDLYIIINSSDRNWYGDINQETPYKFKISLGKSSKYLDSNGRKYDTSTSLPYNLDNYNNLVCSKIICPNRTFIDGFKISNLKYIALTFDNLRMQNNNSNQRLSNAFSILRPALNSGSDLDTIEYLSIDKSYKQFSKIKEFDLKLLRDDGTLINYDEFNNDTLNIKFIWYNNSTKLINIVTSKFFNNDEYKSGDIIEIKNYIYGETDLTFSEIAQFNTFINRDESHIIQSITRFTGAESSNYYNVLQINPPGSINTLSGEFEISSWFSDLITKTSVDNIERSMDNAGILLNYNLQTTIILKAVQ